MPITFDMSETQELYERFRSRDPLLFAQLYSGEPEAVAAVTRLLRLTRLTTLARHRGALVDVLAALPELHVRLRRTWESQDIVLTARLFAWSERTRTRLMRAA